MKKFLCLAIIAIICVFSAQHVHAWYTYYFQSWDLVDSGKHLDWDGSTVYLNEFNYGVSQWNSQISGVIRKDTAFITEDVAIMDVFAGNNGVPAETFLAGSIKFNRSLMDGYNTVFKKYITTHELGHALRLDHRYDLTSIMQATVQGYCTLNNDDITHFQYAYNNYY